MSSPFNADYVRFHTAALKETVSWSAGLLVCSVYHPHIAHRSPLTGNWRCHFNCFLSIKGVPLRITFINRRLLFCWFGSVNWISNRWIILNSIEWFSKSIARINTFSSARTERGGGGSTLIFNSSSSTLSIFMEECLLCSLSPHPPPPTRY